MIPILDKEFYTVPELEKLAKVARPTVYAWIQRGWLKAYKVGGRQRINKEEFEKFLNR
jgi:excisionase family DNA binding protein